MGTGGFVFRRRYLRRNYAISMADERVRQHIGFDTRGTFIPREKRLLQRKSHIVNVRRIMFIRGHKFIMVNSNISACNIQIDVDLIG